MTFRRPDGLSFNFEKVKTSNAPNLRYIIEKSNIRKYARLHGIPAYNNFVHNSIDVWKVKE